MEKQEGTTPLDRLDAWLREHDKARVVLSGASAGCNATCTITEAPFEAFVNSSLACEGAPTLADAIDAALNELGAE